METTGFSYKVGVILLLVALAAGEAELPRRHDCPHKCGGVDITYPFGVGDHCSLNFYFNLTCNHSTSTLYYGHSNIHVLNISLLAHHMDISAYVSRNCYDQSGREVSDFYSNLRITAFPISSSENKFVSVGCDSYAYLTSFQDGQNYSTGCLSRCNRLPPLIVNNTGGETCSGIGCCQVDIPPRMRNITLESYSFNNHKDVWGFNNCSYAFVAKRGSFNFSHHYDLERPRFVRSQLVLDWSIVDEATFQQDAKPPKPICNPNALLSHNSPSGFGYRCSCKPGFQGNPYLPDGCQDVNECDAPNSHKCDIKAHALCNNFDGGYNCSCPPGYTGDGYVDGNRCTRDSPDFSRSLIIALGVCVALLVGFTLVFTLCWAHKQQTLKQIRERDFDQNGGNMLLQRLSQQQGYADRTKIFTQVELQNATNNFDDDRILGRGDKAQFTRVYYQTKHSLPLRSLE